MEVSGSVVANTVNGELKVVFDQLSSDKANSFVTMNGDIDLTLPEGVNANLKLLSQTGEVYSGLDLDFEVKAEKVQRDTREEDGDFRVRVENALRAVLGSGGPEISLESFSGNLYLRKRE